MWFRFLCLVLALWFGAGLNDAADAQAQLLTGSRSANAAPDNDAAPLADAIRQAAEAGVGVIVIDSSGQVITTAPGPATGSDGGAERDGHSMLMSAQSEIDKFRDTLKERVAALPNSINEVMFILRATSPDGRIMTYAKVLGINLLLFALGILAMREIYGKRLAKRYVVSRIQEAPQGYREKMPFLVFRFLMGIGGTVFAMILAYVVGLLVFGQIDDKSVEYTVTAIFVAFFAIRTVSDLWRMILSPYLSQYRIPRFSDRDAKRLYTWAWVLATYEISAVMFSTWIGDFGLNYNVYAILYGVLSLVGVVGNLLLILFNAGPISEAIRGGRNPGDVSWLIRFLSFAWAPVLMLYVVFSWIELAFNLVLELPISVPLIAGSYGVFMTIVVVYGAINYWIERYFVRFREIERLKSEHAAAESQEADAPAPPFQPHPIATFEDLARRVAGILAFLVGSYALLRIWQPEMSIEEGSLLDTSLDVIAILFIGYVLFHFFRIWIDSRIAQEAPAADEGELGDEGGMTGASRLATLLPLFRGAILAVVIVSIALIALMEIGINVSPLFAGAGVVGLAVGFGAQTLVRDIFSGAFFLIDDAFRKGEYIDIGDVKGTVEKISVRSFQLRHHLGALNTIPFGEIKVLTNYSRDWVIMKLPLRVTYDTDVEKVRKLIKKLGQELLSDPVIGDNFIQPLKSQGVIEMQDSAMIIRVKFMTKPGDQWLVRKRVYQDIRELFAREGIKFAHREVTVRLADEHAEDLSPKQREAVTGAVQAAIDEDYLGEDGGGDDR
ncbi:mechanosensitive ion channel family protein [Seohaeicola saemankumensis]|nr:mechanosensitive ion channel family protein [Seohaeicola saemankumensis]MCA0871192.1 mechanosensitive ion channel family protein [Seohaeicola saemankumensis]